MLKATKLLFVFLLLSNISWSQGDACNDPIDLNADYPIVGNGSQSIMVDATENHQFYTYTATESGTIEVSSRYTTSAYSMLKVYESTCNNLIGTYYRNFGLYSAKFVVAVEPGDTYIFEWFENPDVVETLEPFNTNLAFQESVAGSNCDSPKALQMGSNLSEYWFGYQYFTYTASEDGELYVSTCGDYDVYGIAPMRMFDGCNGNEIGTKSACNHVPGWDFEDWSDVTYNISAGETVIVRTDNTYYTQHNFNAEFKSDCQINKIDLNADYPIIGNGYQTINVDATASSQFYTYTATAFGNIQMTSANTTSNFTMLNVYEGTCDNLVATRYRNQGLASAEFTVAVAPGDTYIFEWFENPDDVITPASFPVRFYFQEPKEGSTCDNPKELLIGSNLSDYWFGYQYFTYTAVEAGTLNIYNCDNYDPHWSHINLLDACGGSNIGIDTYCEGTPLWDEEIWSNITYDMAAGETVIVRIENMLTEQTLTADFTPACTVNNVTVSESICDSFEFDGNLLTTSGTYNGTFTNLAGCDSLVTLNLTVNNATSSTLNETACDEYDFLGTLLTTSGTYQETIINVVGCDSLITLNLTINNATSSILNETACDEYDFLGTLLTTSGTYEETIPNTVGCDSLVTLNLIINPRPDILIEQDGAILNAISNSGINYQWVDCDNNNEAMVGENNEQFIAPYTGNFAVLVSDENCTSLSDCVLADWNLILGTPDISNNAIRVYPTIVKDGKITIESSYELDEGVITITSLSGQQVSNQKLINTRKQNLYFEGPSGIYILQVIYEGQIVINQRIIKSN